MPYVIDGNNVIGCSPDISLGEPGSRDKLLQIIHSYQVSRSVNMTVVFDGEPDRGAFRQNFSPKLTVMFPQPGQTADEVIKEILERYANLREVTLVTSDRELKTYAKERSGHTMNSIEFYYELKKGARLSSRKEEHQKRIDASPSQTEVEQWLKIFDEG
jgi:predicted RNA-binding protein with PIN domain